MSGHPAQLGKPDLFPAWGTTAWATTVACPLCAAPVAVALRIVPRQRTWVGATCQPVEGHGHRALDAEEGARVVEAARDAWYRSLTAHDDA